MKCPKCGGGFQAVLFENVEIDRCSVCHGLWFDTREKDQLLDKDGAEAIDIGDEKEGALFDGFRNARCPRCDIRMVSMVDKDQFHIHYESCPRCYGCFLDAGEFRDLKEHTLAERVSRLFRTLKSNLR